MDSCMPYSSSGDLRSRFAALMRAWFSPAWWTTADMFVALAGLMLLLPTWLTLAVFTATLAGVRNQVVEEERYLRRTYGGAFDAYAKRVGRFVPGLGTLAD